MVGAQTGAREGIDLEAVKAHGGFSLRDAADQNSDRDESDEETGPVKRCPECRRQISVSPRRAGVEYGHANGNGGGERCSRRPNCVDPSAREEWPTYYGINPDLLTDDGVQEGGKA